MLEVADIQTYYGTSHVLHGASLRMARPCVALLGRNGMGKTTFLRSVMGLTPAAGGSIRFAGHEIRTRKPHEIARLGIGYVPQGRRLFPSLTVHEHLHLASRGQKKDGAWTIERVYDMFPEVARRRNISGTRLSGGEQQMLAIGRALMTDPDLILMDEPSMGLAPIVVNEVFDIIREVRSMGKTILLVEQNAALALETAEEAHVLELGKVVLSGTGKALLDDPEVKKAYLGL